MVDGFAQEGGFFAGAFHQMDGGPCPVGKRAGDDQPGKAGAGAEVDPAFGVGRQGQELERVGDVAGPDVGSVERAIRLVVAPLAAGIRRSDRAAPLFHVKQA